MRGAFGASGSCAKTDAVNHAIANIASLARIRARTRVSAAAQSSIIRYADLIMDTAKHEVWRGQHLLNLTRTEFSILECLLRFAGRVATRRRIVDVVWGDRGVSHNNLDVFMQFLRRKVDPPGVKKLTQTERGLGYSLRDDG